MSVPDTATYMFSDICNEIYGSTSTNGRNLMQCFLDANGVFDSRYNPNSVGNKNNFLNFRNYNHSQKFIKYTITDTVTTDSGLYVTLTYGNFQYLNTTTHNQTGYISNGISGTYDLVVTNSDVSPYTPFNITIKKDGVTIINQDNTLNSLEVTFTVDYGHYYEIIVTNRVVTPTSINIYVNYSNNDGNGTCRIVIGGVTTRIKSSSSFTIAIGTSFYVTCTSPSTQGCYIDFSYDSDSWKGPKSVSSSVYNAASGMNNATFTVITGYYI